MRVISILLFCLHGAFSQNFPRGAEQSPSIVGKISGTLLDARTEQPVAYASIALAKSGDNKIVNGAVSDNKGFFKLENVPVGLYTVSIHFVGYDKKVIDSVLTTPEKPDKSLGKIALSPAVVPLDNVVIEGDAPVIENRVDKIVYNADKDITSQGGDASDVLQKVPMVSVDIDGNVMLRGSSNVKILINGKPSGIMANSIADALKMIPSDQIKSVEVITSPSAKYDAEGTAGIINIITKKKSIEGTGATLNAGAGTRNNSLNASLNRKRGRLGINFTAGSSFNFPPKGFTEFYREDTYNDTLRTLQQNGSFQPVRMGINGSSGMDYDFNAYHNFSTNARFNYGAFNRASKVDVHLIDPALSLDRIYTRSSTNLGPNISLDWSADYKRTFTIPQKEFSVSLQYSHSVRNSAYTLEQTGDQSYKERSFNDGINREITAQTDYALPVKKNILIETGVKSITRIISSDYSYDLFNNLSGGYENISARSNVFEYNQYVMSGYAMFTYKLKDKYSFLPGIRYEYTLNRGDFTSGGVVIENNYGHLIPSLTLARTFSKAANVKISYSQRIQRPGLRNLNPYADASDPKNVSKGNPYLTPELTHSFELTLGGFSKKMSGTASLFYRHTTNVIQSYMEVDSGGVSVTSYQNIGASDNSGVNLFGQVVFFKFWTLRGSANVFYVSQEGTFDNITLTNEGVQYNLSINSSLQFNKGWSVEFFGMINSPRTTLQGKSPTMSMMNTGVKKELWKKKGSIGVVMYNPFNGYLRFKSEMEGETFYQRSENAVPFRSFGINFSYKYGKLDFRNEMRSRKKKGVNNDDIKKEDAEF